MQEQILYTQRAPPGRDGPVSVSYSKYRKISLYVCRCRVVRGGQIDHTEFHLQNAARPLPLGATEPNR